METCYEYLECNQEHCICYQSKMMMPCWHVENALCHHDSFRVLRDRYKESQKDVCCQKGCIYYKMRMREKFKTARILDDLSAAF